MFNFLSKLSWKRTSNFSSQTRKLNNTAYTKRRNVDTSTRNPYRSLNPDELRTYKALALDLFRSSPVIHAACNKFSEHCGALGWKPKIKTENKDFNREATRLLEDVYRNPTIYGINMTLNRLAVVMSNELFISGDFVYFIVTMPNGLPKLAVYPGTVVGSRANGPVELEDSPFRGFILDDGIITHKKNDIVVGYNVLGETEDTDYRYALNEATLIYEPETLSRRGISKIASSLISIIDIDDISQDYSQIIRNENKLRVIGKVAGGNGSPFGQSPMISRDNNGTITNSSPLKPEVFESNNILFIDTDEELKSFDTNRPNVNGQNWIQYGTDLVCSDLGWPHALLSPEKLTTSNLESIETQVQNAIDSRIETLRRPIVHYSMYVLRAAMEQGLLPEVDINYRDITYTPPPLFTIRDQTNNDISKLANGLTTVRAINEKNGINHELFIEEQNQELIDFATRAAELAKQTGFSKEQMFNALTNQSKQINVSEQIIKSEK